MWRGTEAHRELRAVITGLCDVQIEKVDPLRGEDSARGGARGGTGDGGIPKRVSSFGDGDAADARQPGLSASVLSKGLSTRYTLTSDIH